MRKRLLTIVFLLIIYIYIINIGILYSDFPAKRITGAGITTATVSLTIIEPNSTIVILSPLNQTYNFSIGDNYTLDLNVSIDFIADSLTYTLIDTRHDTIVNDSIAFSPNITFNAVRWNNRLNVSAIKNGTGEIISQYVDFYISVPNSAPYFSPIDSPQYICENDALSYFFNVTDVDEQALELSLTPTDPFYLSPLLTSASVQTSQIELFSGTLSEADSTQGVNGWQTYNEKIEVTDNYNATCCSDTAYTNITAIRVNDYPIVPIIGVQTVYTRGDDSTFYKVVQVNDEEDGDETSVNINFNISFINSTNLFDITNEGVMNFTPDSNQTGVYNIIVCANDTGINNPYSGISTYCGQDGGPLTTCRSFSLTVTDANRAPTIIDYNPSNLTLYASSTTTLNFNITKYDPDGTIPDTYWYVDGVLDEYDGNGSSTDFFSHNFGCGSAGARTIKAEITDGLLNDSIEWTIVLSKIECQLPSGSGGGGGGGSTPGCTPLWVCNTWEVCQNLKTSLGVGLVSGEDYRNMQNECLNQSFNIDSCGIQTRICSDLKSCNVKYNKPDEIQVCHYTAEPSCYDNIKNCHDGACELLVDCGGPCDDCPSCSDKKQNQGEDGVDCGGPCPWKCEIEVPFTKTIKPYLIYSLLILLILLIILVTIKIRQILKHKKRLM